MRDCLLIGGTLDEEHRHASLFAQDRRQRPEPYCPERFLGRDYGCQPLQAEGKQILLIQYSRKSDTLLVEDTGSYRLPPRKDNFPYDAKRPGNPFSMSHLSEEYKGLFEQRRCGNQIILDERLPAREEEGEGNAFLFTYLSEKSQTLFEKGAYTGKLPLRNEVSPC